MSKIGQQRYGCNLQDNRFSRTIMYTARAYFSSVGSDDSHLYAWSKTTLGNQIQLAKHEIKSQQVLLAFPPNIYMRGGGGLVASRGMDNQSRPPYRKGCQNVILLRIIIRRHHAFLGKPDTATGQKTEPKTNMCITTRKNFNASYSFSLAWS